MASENWRYDDGAGVLWLNEEFAIDLRYDYTQRVWAVGANPNHKFPGEADAVAAAQRILRAAANERGSHVRDAGTRMDAALAAAGIPVSAIAPG